MAFTQTAKLNCQKCTDSREQTLSDAYISLETVWTDIRFSAVKLFLQQYNNGGGGPLFWTSEANKLINTALVTKL